MISLHKASSINRYISSTVLVCCLTGLACCTSSRPSSYRQERIAAAAMPAEDPSILNIEKTISHAVSMAGGGSARQAAPVPLTGYLENLLADGRLSIGLGIGTDDLGLVKIPSEPEKRSCRLQATVCGRPIQVEGRLILTREDFKRALSDCEIIFVTSHSRFGAGPVFKLDGKAYPFLMQKTPGYEIIMPDAEVCGYEGKIKRRFYNKARAKHYSVFEPDGSDLDNATPLHGYQLIVLSTCTSQKHFLDEVKCFRAPYPTTAIFTTQAACVDQGMNVFICMLAELFRGRPLPDTVAAMNRAYRTVAERNVRMNAKGWKIVEEMYSLGINTVPR